jgi:hypothetical protein
MREGTPLALAFTASNSRARQTHVQGAPHLTRSGREAIISAGALDDDRTCRPEDHVRWSSRASWFVHGEPLPKDDW